MDDLISSISGFKQATTMSQVQIAVAKKVLDNQQLQGDAAIQLINAASKGADSASNSLVAAATGLGATVDAQG